MGAKQPSGASANPLCPPAALKQSGQVPGEVIPETSTGNEGIGKPPSAATSTLATAEPIEPSRRRASPTISPMAGPVDDKKTLLGT
jgi:hypothetical protein